MTEIIDNCDVNLVIYYTFGRSCEILGFAILKYNGLMDVKLGLFGAWCVGRLLREAF